MSPHTKLVHECLLALSELEGVVVWNLNQGDGERDGRYAKFGLVPGAADILGLVAPSGRFLALECKTGKGRPTAEQKLFLNLVRSLGGVSRVVRTKEEAQEAAQLAKRGYEAPWNI